MERTRDGIKQRLKMVDVDLVKAVELKGFVLC